MHGFRLDVETHIITAAVTSVQNLVKCIRSIGIDIDDLILEPLASNEAVLTEDEKQIGVILADIGGGTTDIAVFREGSIWHTAILPVAGYQVTRDIAIGLGLPFEVAEEMKKRYGSVMPVYEGKTEATNPISEDGHGVSYQDLCDIIRARVEEIIRLILLELPRSEYETLVLSVRVGIPGSNVSGITDILHDPAYATSVGLLLWGAKHEGMQTWQSYGFGAVLRRLISRIKNLFQ
jgi:cell division protein FtsA